MQACSPGVARSRPWLLLTRRRGAKRKPAPVSARQSPSSVRTSLERANARPAFLYDKKRITPAAQLGERALQLRGGRGIDPQSPLEDAPRQLGVSILVGGDLDQDPLHRRI